jgi:hypothetical protein
VDDLKGVKGDSDTYGSEKRVCLPDSGHAIPISDTSLERCPRGRQFEALPEYPDHLRAYLLADAFR